MSERAYNLFIDLVNKLKKEKEELTLEEFMKATGIIYRKLVRGEGD